MPALQLRSGSSLRARLRSIREMSYLEQLRELPEAPLLLFQLAAEEIEAGRKNRPLHRAIALSGSIIADHYDNPELAQFRERVEWICEEMNIAENGQGDANLCRQYRRLFSHDEGGCPIAWTVAYNFVRRMELEGPAIRAFLELLTATRTGDPSVNHRHLCMRLGAELELTKGRDSWLSARLRHFFERSYHLDRIEMTSRLQALEREYLFGLDFPEGLDLTIDLYGNGRGIPAPEYVISDMLAVCNGRVIDRGKQVPQNGFGRQITREEIGEALAIPGAVLVVLSLDGLRAGFYLLLTECETYPEYVKRIMKLCGESGILRRARTGWLEYVVLEEAASERMSAYGLSGYGLMHWAGCALAADAQVKHVLCSVRSGRFANTAIGPHERRGLYRLGLEVTPETMAGFSSDPATIMKCDLYSLPRADWYATSAATHDRGVRF